MDRLARATLKRDDFLHNQVLQEIPIFQGIFTYLTPLHPSILCATLRGPREGPCILLVTISEGGSSGKWCEEFPLKALSPAELSKVRDAFERPTTSGGRGGLPMLYVPTRPPLAELFSLMADVVERAEQSGDVVHGMRALANYCGMAAAFGREELSRSLVRELRTAIHDRCTEDEREGVFLQAISSILRGAGSTSRGQLLGDLLDELLPPGALAQIEFCAPREMRDLAKVMSDVLFRTKNLGCVDAVFGALQRSEHKALLSALVLQDVVLIGANRGIVGRLLKRVEEFHLLSELPISKLISSTLFAQSDFFGAGDEALETFRLLCDECLSREGAEGELRELAAWLFGNATGQFLHASCSVHADEQPSEKAVAAVAQEMVASELLPLGYAPAVLRGLLTFDRGIRSREVTCILESDIVQGALARPMIDAFKVLSGVAKVYRDEGWSLLASHSAALRFSREIVGRYSSADATAFVEVLLQEALAGAAVAFDPLRSELTDVALRIASSGSVPTGFLSSDMSLHMFPHIEKGGIFRLMRDADMLGIFFREFSGDIGSTPSDKLVVRLLLQGECMRSAHQPGVSEGETREIVGHLSSPETTYPLEGWSAILEAALSSSQDYFVPVILSRMRSAEEPHAPFAASEAMLVGLCRSLTRST